MPLAGADSVRHGRVARGIGFGLGGLMLVAAGLQQDVPPWQLLVVAVIALGWPQLAHAHGLRAGADCRPNGTTGGSTPRWQGWPARPSGSTPSSPPCLW
jgi:hypothetical protein